METTLESLVFSLTDLPEQSLTSRSRLLFNAVAEEYYGDSQASAQTKPSYSFEFSSSEVGGKKRTNHVRVKNGEV